jgi:integrase/recombinase XerD
MNPQVTPTAHKINPRKGHETPESSRPYLHADLQLKQRALDRTAPPHTTPGRYIPTDALLAFLEGL